MGNAKLRRFLSKEASMKKKIGKVLFALLVTTAFAFTIRGVWERDIAEGAKVTITVGILLIYAMYVTVMSWGFKQLQK